MVKTGHSSVFRKQKVLDKILKYLLRYYIYFLYSALFTFPLGDDWISNKMNVKKLSPWCQ